MNNNSANVFDSSAGVYDEMIKKGMVLPGSDHAYFEQYKMHYLRPYLTQCRKLLDCGCGIGRFSQVVQECYPQMVIHGYDVSKESIAVVSPELLHGENKFVSTRDELDFDYDVVLLITVLHHVALGERLDVIRDAVSRLKPGGVLVVIEHNMQNFLTKRSVDACPLDDSVLFDAFDCEYDAVFTCPPYGDTEHYYDLGAENLPEDAFGIWWSNVVYASAKSGCRYFCVVTNQVYKNLFLEGIVENGFHLIEECDFRKQGSGSTRGSGRHKRSFESLLICERDGQN